MQNFSYAALEITVGENLSYPDERIVKGTPQEIAAGKFDDLNLVIVRNPDVMNRP